MIQLAQGLDNLRKVASEIFGSEQTSVDNSPAPAPAQTWEELSRGFREIGGQVGS